VEAQRSKKIDDPTDTLLIDYADNLIVKYQDFLPEGESCGP
jgi:hypothetical protein